MCALCDACSEYKLSSSCEPYRVSYGIPSVSQTVAKHDIPILLAFVRGDSPPSLPPPQIHTYIHPPDYSISFSHGRPRTDCPDF